MGLPIASPLPIAFWSPSPYEGWGFRSGNLDQRPWDPDYN